MSFNLLFLSFVIKFLLELRCNAQLIPLDEVRALAQIGRKLGADKLSTTRMDQQVYPWLDLKPDSCVLNSLVFRERPGSSIVRCDCTFNNNTTCHVIEIELKEHNLSGELPEEFADLPFLSRLNLSYNYINGSIPRRWASLPLTNLNIAGNLIGGTIPEELGNVMTLTTLNLVDNLIGGQLPPELGNLSGLKMFLLSGNNFTGVLPNTFGNLKNLTDFRIDGSTLSGRIPEFIGNWRVIRRLNMRGTSLQGPIPSSISGLTNLEILRISDLDVENMSFPNLRVLTRLTELVLRNCSIIGQIPSYIGENMQQMKNLDLSFNRLNGTIPESLGSLLNLEHMYLTNNGLSGEIQSWLQETSFFDISYNNYTGNPLSYNCRTDNRNQISSYAALTDKSIPWCLKKDLPCATNPNNYELFINCGGPRMSFEDREYEQDESNMGPSSFFSNDKWASSTTGYYHQDSLSTSKYFARRGDPSLYSTARRAPLSIKYYGRCLQSGNYTLKLHFAEIMLRADQANNVRGRRMFDVYVQGNKVIADFNIAEEAGGIDISVIKKFNVTVTKGTLEIHLHWSGKGTIDYAPYNSVYGPLISAITLTPNFNISSGEGVSATEELSVGAISGIVVGSVGGVILILVVIWKLGYLGGKDNELRGLELQTGYYTLRQIKDATGNFDPANKIGEGGFGPVFKGVLSDGSVIAVKQLSSKSKQGNKEFITEIVMLTSVQNEQLVRLYGCCIENNQLLLIYEYMENNSLANALFGGQEQRLYLDWPTRQKICLGIAKGLRYLHEESRIKIVHRDMKATNVLLDKNLNAKISDFGLAKPNDEENTHISTGIAGTFGYMAPEYAIRGHLTEKADVYSFGIIALEIVSGKSMRDYIPREEFLHLLDQALVLQEQGNLLDLVDPTLGTNYSKKEAMQMLNISLLCTNRSPTLRPAMSSVVRMLEGWMPVSNVIVGCQARVETENLSHDSATESSLYSHNSQTHNLPMDGTWTDSATESSLYSHNSHTHNLPTDGTWIDSATESSLYSHNSQTHNLPMDGTWMDSATESSLYSHNHQTHNLPMDGSWMDSTVFSPPDETNQTPSRKLLTDHV